MGETAVAQGAREAAPAERDDVRGRQAARLGKVAFAASTLFAAL